MALDHSGLGLENKFLGNKPGRIFWVRQVYFTKSSQQIWGGGGGCKPTFYTFNTSHLRWNSTIYHTDLVQNAVFHKFSRQIALSQIYIQNDLSCAFSETVQKISKITYTASRFSLLTTKAPICGANCGQVLKWTLIELRFSIIKNLLMYVFVLMVLAGFITMCNLKKRLIRVAFWLLLQAMFMNDWKQTAQRLTLQERLLMINNRSILRWNIYRWTRGKKIAQSFLSTAKFITKYSSERFLSICGKKIYLKDF